MSISKSTNKAASEGSFFGLGIAPNLLDSLSRLKFTNPTPIQHKTIPLGIEGKDVMGIAQTGTGKTLAFGIPMLQRLAQKEEGRGLVLVPTRELAFQVQQSLEKVDRKTKQALIIGGAPMHKQIQQLRRKPQVIIATPGRLIDHMKQKNISLKEVSILVLDEADRMLDMGFMPQIQEILRKVPKNRQTLLFSATMPTAIVRIASDFMKLPVQVEVAKSGTVAEKVTQELFIIRNDAKKNLLNKLLSQYQGTILIFSRTKIGAVKIVRMVSKAGHSAADIHSDKTLAQRRQALEGFRSGRYRILIATDIAARGIDVSGIELVINYDLPDEAENYIHRIGRTGRAGDKGHAISFATPDQRNEVKRIEKLMEAVIPISEHPEMPMEKFMKPVTVFKSRRSFGGNARRRRR